MVGVRGGLGLKPSVFFTLAYGLTAMMVALRLKVQVSGHEQAFPIGSSNPIVLMNGLVVVVVTQQNNNLLSATVTIFAFAFAFFGEKISCFFPREISPATALHRLPIKIYRGDHSKVSFGRSSYLGGGSFQLLECCY